MNNVQDLNLSSLVDSYYEWLKSETKIKTINGIGEITTPYLNRHNDFIQIYAVPKGEYFLLTDLGETVADLEMSGCSLHTQTRQRIFNETIRGFGVAFENNELAVKATKSDFPSKKHQLVQAILAVDDIFFTSRQFVQSLFLENVTAWLRNNEVRFSPRVQFTGRGGVPNLFDFLIAGTKSIPERLVKAITNPKTDNYKAFAFAWADVKDVRPANTAAYAILNDDKSVDVSGLSVLENYGIQPILWSEREKYLHLLSA